MNVPLQGLHTKLVTNSSLFSFLPFAESETSLDGTCQPAFPLPELLWGYLVTEWGLHFFQS